MTTSNQRSYAAIGRVCVNWSDIEYQCQRIAEVTAPLLAVDCARSDVGLVLSVALAHMDVRNKIATAKAYLAQSSLPASLLKSVVSLLDRIDNDYRIERNRYVHDEWVVSKERSARSTVRPKIVKPQARQSRLLMGQTKMMTVEQMEEFADTLGDALHELAELGDCIEGHFLEIAPALRAAREASDA